MYPYICGSGNEITIYVGDCEKKLYKSLINCFWLFSHDQLLELIQIYSSLIFYLVTGCKYSLGCPSVQANLYSNNKFSEYLVNNEMISFLPHYGKISIKKTKSVKLHFFFMETFPT